MTFRDTLNSADWAPEPTAMWDAVGMPVLVVEPKEFDVMKGKIIHVNGESATVLFPTGHEKYFSNYEIRHVYEFYILPEDD